MSSLTYHTRGIVLDSHNVGEADRIFTVFSKDFGMIRLHAKGIRLLKSKLAGHLTLFSQSRIAFVLGRDMPRLIDAEDMTRFLFSNGAFVAVGRMSHLVIRLVRGQEHDELLWNLLSSAFLFLHTRSKATILSKQEYAYVSLLFGVRLLSRLGYVDNASFSSSLLLDASWHDAIHHQHRFQELAAVFEQGIRTSQL